MIRFNYYGNVSNFITVEQLIEMREHIIARVENSGCEGCFVEVARWSDKRQRWERFAFLKFLGGELDEGRIEGRDAITCCRVVCEQINGVQSEIASLVHTFPTWKEEI